MKKALAALTFASVLSTLALAYPKTLFYDFSSQPAGVGTLYNYSEKTFADGVMTATGTAEQCDPQFNMTLGVDGDDYDIIEMRMKFDLLDREDEKTPITQIYFTGTAADGTALALSEANSVKIGIPKSSQGEYITYTFNMASAAKWSGSKIATLRVDPVNAGGSFSLDYIAIRGSEDTSAYSYTFDTDDDTKGLTFTQKNGGVWTLKNGVAHFKHPGGTTWGDPQIHLPNAGMNGDDYDGVEVVYRHDIGETGSASGNKMQLYYIGMNAQGETIGWSEANSKSTAMPSASSGEGFEYLYIDLTNATNWRGSAISEWRLDVTNTYEDVDIVSVRFVPNAESGKMGSFEHPEALELTYDFDEETGDSAKGTIGIDFGEEPASFAKNVRLNWASGNETSGYTDLAEYTSIGAFDGEKLEKGIRIEKSMIIPFGATALVAHITDKSKQFDIFFPLPDAKQAVDYGTPRYTAAFVTDTHFGYGTTKSKPTLVNHDNAVAFINEYGADFVGLPGDFTQFYGRNENPSKTGPVEEWDLAESWFKKFRMPLYVTNGNHDVPSVGIINSAQYGEGAGYSFDKGSVGYYERFLRKWLDYCNENVYAAPVSCACDGNNWYDAVTEDGTHIISLCVPRWDAEKQEETYSFGSEQLLWLDKVLYDAERSGDPIFILSHGAATGTVHDTNDWWNHQITDSDSLMSVLERHPTAVYINGHSHYALNTLLDNAIDGKGVKPSFVHAGGIHDIEYYDEKGELIQVNGAEGAFVEVYDDRIVVRGRDFIADKWISCALAEIHLAPAPKTDTLLAVKTVEEDGCTLRAVTAEGMSYAWYLNGKLTSTDVTVKTAADYDGYIALRVTDANGGYASVLYESLDEVADAADIGASMFADGRKVNVYGITRDAAMLLAAYDESGRMLAVKRIDITADTVVKPYELFDTDALYAVGGTTMKAYLIDAETLSPVCEAVSLPITDSEPNVNVDILFED